MKSQNVQVGATGKQDYETPDDFFGLVVQEFHFVHDLAAGDENHKCPSYFSLPYNDSLTLPWTGFDGWLWLNPPFADIKPWAKKCMEESRKGARIAMLTLASTGSNWFREYCWGKCEIRLLNGRLKFKPAKDPFPKDLALYVYEPGRIINVDVWDWRKALPLQDGGKPL